MQRGDGDVREGAEARVEEQLDKLAKRLVHADSAS